MHYKKDISIVIPVYNGSDSLKELHNRLNKTLNEMNVSFEIIYVDDCSKDASWKTLKEIHESNLSTLIIRLTKNFGQHNATVCGLSVAQGTTIITMDDDLEHPPEKIPELYNAFLNGKYDVFYAYPANRQKGFLRNTFSHLWAKLAQYSKKGTGKASSFRVMKKEITKCILNHKEPFVYIESILFWYTENTGYKEINFDRRKHGKSNYSSMKLFNLNHDLGMHYDTHVLKIMKNLGSIVCWFAVLLIIYFFLKKIYGRPIPGYTSIITTLLFSTGSLLWGMGYLGLYIGKMFKILNKEPQYNIDQKIEIKE